VRRISTGRILRPWLIDGRYKVVGLHKHGRRFKKFVARLHVGAFGGGLPNGFLVDHRRGIAATRAEITRFATGRIPHSSRYKGVSALGKKWAGYIHIGGRSKLLGVFKTERQAALAYDRAARRAWGKCFQNFSIRTRAALGGWG
jgi:hypothetical protein